MDFRHLARQIRRCTQIGIAASRDKQWCFPPGVEFRVSGRSIELPRSTTSSVFKSDRFLYPGTCSLSARF